jgi:alginate O-acetyltransferase complex protein AlgI
MNFVQFEFPIFFVLVFALFWALKNRTWQNLLLVVCSAIFYGWVHPWFLFLLYGSAVLDFNMGKRMIEDAPNKKRYLWISMLGNVGMLGYFKYCNFFIDNFNAIFSTMGLGASLQNLDIFLPVGISFYTFQTMSYTIDIYKGELKPRNNFIDYLAFISFFPQLVAGPVERAATLLPQMEADKVFQWSQFRSGMQLALWGAFKKVWVADVVAMYVDRIFLLEEPSAAMIWAATLGFTVQILADFSGYTDIARGTARMLGFELMLNFDHPYLAKNPSEFWRRWHISFSTWIRDYLYIPLGGSRGGEATRLKASYGAMLISGLWHGASWSFVLWGAYHATLLAGYKYVGKWIPREIRKANWMAPFSISLMFAFTVAGWMIFRETSIERIGYYLSLPLLEGTSEQWLAASLMLGITLLSAAPLVIGLIIEKLIAPKLEDKAIFLPLQTTSWAILICGIVLMHRDISQDFIYFQF